jgi:hypothetical protein
MTTNSANNDYHADHSIDLNLTRDELVSMSLALREYLGSRGIGMVHNRLTTQPVDGFHPNSHLGRLVALSARVDCALHGSHNWNKDRILTFSPDGRLIETDRKVAP